MRCLKRVIAMEALLYRCKMLHREDYLNSSRMEGR